MNRRCLQCGRTLSEVAVVGAWAAHFPRHYSRERARVSCRKCGTTHEFQYRFLVSLLGIGAGFAGLVAVLMAILYVDEQMKISGNLARYLEAAVGVAATLAVFTLASGALASVWPMKRGTK